MRIGTYALKGQKNWRAAALVDDDHAIDLAAALAAMPALQSAAKAQVEICGKEATQTVFWLDAPGQALARRVLAQGLNAAQSDEFTYTLSAITVGPPLPQPGKFIAIGRNYMNHVKEGQQIWAARGKKVELPTFPAAFAKFSSGLIGDGAEIHLPAGVRSVDYEVELAFVIGKTAFCVSEEDALSCVAGYTICNDVGARELQRLEMESQIGITLSKNFRTFAPTGPWIVTADEIADPQALTVELKVNGERRQYASTGDMIFPVRKIIAYWSQIGLEPGDMITTGTPSGVALAMPDPDKYYLKAGDLVEAEISGIGRLSNRVKDATSSHPLSDFGADWRLKPGIEPQTACHHRPA